MTGVEFALQLARLGRVVSTAQWVAAEGMQSLDAWGGDARGDAAMFVSEMKDWLVRVEGDLAKP